MIINTHNPGTTGQPLSKIVYRRYLITRTSLYTDATSSNLSSVYVRCLTSDQPGPGEPPGELDLATSSGGEVVRLVAVVVAAQAAHFALVRGRYSDLEKTIAVPEKTDT